jgi:hypothetical protein
VANKEPCQSLASTRVPATVWWPYDDSMLQHAQVQACEVGKGTQRYACNAISIPLFAEAYHLFVNACAFTIAAVNSLA